MDQVQNAYSHYNNNTANDNVQLFEETDSGWQPREYQPQQQYTQYTNLQPRLAVKRESTGNAMNVDNGKSNGAASGRSSEDPMPSTSDFVKKLYK